MNRAHFDRLLALELRRLLPVGRRLLIGTLGIGALFLVTGRGNVGNVFGLVIGASVGYVLAAPLQMTRDKMERTLEFLTGLPVEPGTIAVAKFAAAAIFVVPAALQIALALAWYGHSALQLGGDALAALSLATWGILVGASWLMLAATSVTDPERLLGAPMVGVAALVLAASFLGGKVLPHPAETARWFLHQSWAPQASAGILVLAAIVTSVITIRLGTRGIARYQTARDRLV
jgi:ABC-type Na+ efflux pump permease subunit